MFQNNTLSTPEIKAAQSKYSNAQKELKHLEKSETQVSEKLENLVSDEARDNAASAAAQESAVQAYSDAIAEGDMAAERTSDTLLQELLSASEKQKGKRLARTAAIAKLREEKSNLEQQLIISRQSVTAAHKSLLMAIMYKRAEIFREISAKLVEAAKNYKDVAQLLGVGGCLQGIHIPLPPRHFHDQIDYVGDHTIRVDIKSPTIDELLAN